MNIGLDGHGLRIHPPCVGATIVNDVVDFRVFASIEELIFTWVDTMLGHSDGLLVTIVTEFIKELRVWLDGEIIDCVIPRILPHQRDDCLFLHKAAPGQHVLKTRARIMNLPEDLPLPITTMGPEECVGASSVSWADVVKKTGNLVQCKETNDRKADVVKVSDVDKQKSK